MMSEVEWEMSLKTHMKFHGSAHAPERSDYNPIGITEHFAESLATKHNWSFDTIPVPTGEGTYVRAFRFAPLDESIKRIDVERKEEE